MTDSSHLAAPSSGRTSGDAAPTDQIAGPVARINSRVHNCIEWLDANAAANLPNGTPLFTHRPTDDKLFTRPTPAAAADWQISAIADKHVSTFDGRRVLDEVSFGRELLQTLASPAAAAGVPTLKAREHWSTINERLAVLVNMNSLEARPGHEYLNREMVMREVCRIRDAAFALFKASSPVAPVGAPTKLLSVHAALSMCRAANEEARLPVPMCWDLALYVSKLEAQGCELATDATKQLREPLTTRQEIHDEIVRQTGTEYFSPPLHSVHLAATPIDQDFRRRPASSEAAPSADASASPRCPSIEGFVSGGHLDTILEKHKRPKDQK